MAKFLPRVYFVYVPTDDDFRKSVKGVFVDYQAAKECISILRKDGVKCSVVLYEFDNMFYYGA